MKLGGVSLNFGRVFKSFPVSLPPVLKKYGPVGDKGGAKTRGAILKVVSATDTNLGSFRIQIGLFLGNMVNASIFHE